MSEGVVYCLALSDGRVKIGSSKEPDKRIASQSRHLRIMGANMVRVVEVATTPLHPVYKANEHRLHVRFASHRVIGETFAVGMDDVKRAMAELPLVEAPAQPKPTSKLKEVLKAHDIKQRDLAAALGTTESTVSRLLNGEQHVRLQTAVDIVRALEKLTGRTWTVDELIDREGVAA